MMRLWRVLAVLVGWGCCECVRRLRTTSIADSCGLGRGVGMPSEGPCVKWYGAASCTCGFRPLSRGAVDGLGSYACCEHVARLYHHMLLGGLWVWQQPTYTCQVLQDMIEPCLTDAGCRHDKNNCMHAVVRSGRPCARRSVCRTLFVAFPRLRLCSFVPGPLLVQKHVQYTSSEICTPLNHTRVRSHPLCCALFRALDLRRS
jgi:hypothetical protein